MKTAPRTRQGREMCGLPVDRPRMAGVPERRNRHCPDGGFLMIPMIDIVSAYILAVNGWPRRSRQT
jgi:hypothetical protein